VRIGFGYVDGLGEDAARLIQREKASGRYRSLADFVRRVPLKREAVENLIAVGAFGFGLGRREALWQLGLFIPTRSFGRSGADVPASESGRQQPLALSVEQDMVELRPMSPWEQMATDYDTLDLSPRYHPLGLLRPHLPAEIVTTVDLAAIRDGARVQVAGLVVCRQRPGTAKGITFLLLEDERGLVNVIVYPALYEEQRLLVRGEPFLVVEGRLQQREGTINVVAERVQTLDDARRMFSPVSNQPDRQPASDPRTFGPAAHNYR
jgi:error-prone DNA polymerase